MTINCEFSLPTLPRLSVVNLLSRFAFEDTEHVNPYREIGMGVSRIIAKGWGGGAKIRGANFFATPHFSVLKGVPYLMGGFSMGVPRFRGVRCFRGYYFLCDTT